MSREKGRKLSKQVKVRVLDQKKKSPGMNLGAAITALKKGKRGLGANCADRQEKKSVHGADLEERIRGKEVERALSAARRNIKEIRRKRKSGLLLERVRQRGMWKGERRER